jgi:hypothetical protein
MEHAILVEDLDSAIPTIRDVHAVLVLRIDDDRVQAHAPRAWLPLRPGSMAAQAGQLRARGSKVEAIFPDSNSRNAFGVNLMDPSTRPPSARAGYNQGRALAGQLTEFWR